MESRKNPPAVVRLTLGLEEATSLDGTVLALEPKVAALFAAGTRGKVLRGDWLGHALHPLLTDAVVGTWMSASLLDVVGGPSAAPAARTLVGTGLLAAVPTAWTGWAEWAHAGPREKRVGVVHAANNAVAIAAYAASYAARRRGNHRAGAALAAVGMGVSGVGAYLGGHLAAARKVSSHHPAFDEATAAEGSGA